MAPADLGFLADKGAGFVLLLLQFDFVELGLQHLPAIGLVLVLRTLGLAGHRDIGGNMRDAHGAFGLVDMLAARAAGTIDVNAHVFFRHLDIDGLVNHRIDGDAGERGVPPRCGIKRRNPHQPVHPRFRFQPAIGIVAIDADGGRFQPRRFAFAFLDQLQFIVMLLGPARVHAKQHGGPVLAFGAAGPGMDFQIGVVAVRFPGQHGLQPLFFGAGRQRQDGFFGIAHHGGVVFRFRHFDQADGVGQFVFEAAYRPQR